MAGNGPAPKMASQRRRTNKPARGEWIDLPELDGPILPDLPERSEDEGGWSERTRRAWEAWQIDRATTQFTASEIALITEVAYLWEAMARGDTKLAPEIRLRLNELGLTPKGKKDLRWRVPEDQPVIERQETTKVKRRVLAVD